MLVIGLTGGIGSGKSTVSGVLADLGATVIDADKVGHQTLKPKTPAWHDIVAAFGRGVLKENEEVDRAKLGQIVFSDPKALKQLNAIMHPRMAEMMRDMIAGLEREGTKVVVLEAAILIEAGWLPLVDQVWVISVAEETAIQRLTRRNGMNEEQARARIHSQLSNEERAKYADVIIDTNCSLDEVKCRVRDLWEQGCSPSQAKSQ